MKVLRRFQNWTVPPQSITVPYALVLLCVFFSCVQKELHIFWVKQQQIGAIPKKTKYEWDP